MGRLRDIGGLKPWAPSSTTRTPASGAWRGPIHRARTRWPAHAPNAARPNARSRSASSACRVAPSRSRRRAGRSCRATISRRRGRPLLTSAASAARLQDHRRIVCRWHGAGELTGDLHASCAAADCWNFCRDACAPRSDLTSPGAGRDRRQHRQAGQVGVRGPGRRRAIEAPRASAREATQRRRWRRQL